MIPQPQQTGPLPTGSGLQARIYPNGELVVYKPRAKARKRLKDFIEDEYTGGWKSLWNVALMQLGVLPPKADSLGLSPLRNFDKTLDSRIGGHQGASTVLNRYGRNGITSYGARRVRNCCYELETRAPKQCIAFATATVPDLPYEMMARLHEKWHVVVDAYRRKLTRRLKNDGLSGDSVTVSEVQEKRYQRTGLPTLHLHTVFIGRYPGKSWVISTEDHDDIWASSLAIALGEGVPEISSACNIQRVKKSAEGYLGKYMTKGCKVVRDICKAGFSGWLPKQWWGASRGLTRAVDDKTRCAPELADWLNYVADIEGVNVWLWHRDVSVEMSDGQTITMARYGRLGIRYNAEIQAYLNDPSEEARWRLFSLFS